MYLLVTKYKVIFMYFFKDKIYLVESIIQRLVQVFQVQQDNSFSSFHAHLNPINVPANLWNYEVSQWCLVDFLLI